MVNGKRDIVSIAVIEDSLSLIRVEGAIYKNVMKGILYVTRSANFWLCFVDNMKVGDFGNSNVKTTKYSLLFSRG